MENNDAAVKFNEVHESQLPGEEENPDADRYVACTN